MEEVGLLAFFAFVAGGAIGLAGAALWWSIATLLGIAIPGEDAWLACAGIGAISGTAIALIALFVTILRSDRR